MSRPLDRNAKLPELGDLDREAGEFWVENPFQMPGKGYNLSAYERNRLFLNDGGEMFLEGTFASQADADSDSRSVIATDFDLDGRPDLLVGSVGGGPLRLFRNTGVTGHHRLRIDLVGETSNRPGIGARLIAQVGGREIRRDVFPANGGTGLGPVETILGLGQARKVDRLEVRWPSGQTQTFKDLPADRRVILREGQAQPGVLPLRPADD